jgi:hypothetical protein
VAPIEPERNMGSSIGRERSDQEKRKKGTIRRAVRTEDFSVSHRPYTTMRRDDRRRVA